ncbi:Crp/Fnr family transcriptional regulator [Microvirga zambiensis]|uniref:Crp/Fnr family transcriptional regulator n=1 Tax=Microvirga zambiensis TaxID=1402137 RepID=UPI00191D6B7F|nr:Crp/Fnr family transcriptional regulator [Microvirga zambiensis]
MATYLIRKLEQFTQLSSEDKQKLERAAAAKVRVVRPREDIIREGDKPRQVNLILDGWACRYKVLEDGRRQIVGFLVPGDVCDIRMFILKQIDHSMGALTPVRVAEIPSDTLLDVIDTSPRLTRAMWWNSLVEEAISREWTTSLGQREAIERLSHLFCELYFRLKAVGLTENGQGRKSFEFPVTQDQLADATGMSTVHVNRTLQLMREQELIIWKGKTVTIPDLEALMSVAMFNANYLHLDRDGHELDANEP